MTVSIDIYLWAHNLMLVFLKSVQVEIDVRLLFFEAERVLETGQPEVTAEPVPIGHLLSCTLLNDLA